MYKHYYKIFKVDNGYGFRHYICRQRNYPIHKLELGRKTYFIDNSRLMYDLVKYLKTKNTTVTLNGQVILFTE